jgi:hypothetical protein
MTTKITDLLPIPEGTREPHAYQVFGLEVGEQDSRVIAAAVKHTVSHLKSVKDSTDPKLWAKAAKVVQQARVTLADPEKKSQLDARFGIFSIEEENSPPPTKSAAVDPLAGMLPSSDPLAAMLPATNPLAPIAPVPSPVAVAQPATPHASATANQSAFEVASVTVPMVKKAKVLKRRRRSIVGTLAFGVFTLGMIGVISVLAWFLMFGSGQVAITNSGDGLTITTKPQTEGIAVGDPANPAADDPPPREIDPVMGHLASNTPPPRDPSRSINSEIEDPLETTPLETTPMETVPMETVPMETVPMETVPMETVPMETTPPDPAMTPEPPAPEPPAPPPLTEEMIAAASQAIERTRELVRGAKWREMKAVAEATLALPMNEQQKSEADTLYEIADLATYYREGIDLAVKNLSIGNDFEVAADLRVIVVEKGEDLLVVRYNEKNRSFKFDEFPFSLAHKLASFSIPASPTTDAAKAVYQALAPSATQGHREEAIAWLRQITAEVEGADLKRIADMIEQMYADAS